MTPLLIIWSISLIVLLVLGGVGLRATAPAHAGAVHQGNPLHDFFIRESRELGHLARRVFQFMEPPMRAAGHMLMGYVHNSTAYLRKEATQRFYGKGEVQRGTASSFFLKNIAEGKGKDQSSQI